MRSRHVVRGVSGPVSEQVGEQVSEQVSEQAARILVFCEVARTKGEILAHLGLAPVYLNYRRHIHPWIQQGLLERTIPDKPRSRLQKYRLTAKGRAWVRAPKKELR